MNIAQGSKNFSDLFPDMMKATRLLIIDYDVMRYHSFDLLRYTLFTRKDLFGSLKKEYQKLIIPHQEVAEQVQFMRKNVEELNIFDMFNVDAGVHTSAECAEKFREMFTDKIAKITPTDISNRFNIVFNNSNITGYLLRYTGDPNIPTCYHMLTVYESPNVLDLSTAVKIITKHQINAVMIGPVVSAIELVARLADAGYKQPITVITGNYAYNYRSLEGDEGWKVPFYSREMTYFSLKYRHEFGFFDPFTGLTYREKVIRQEEEQ